MLRQSRDLDFEQIDPYEPVLFGAMKQHPSRFLVENISFLSRGRALDIAMGGGRNAVYLASMGFEVEGVDISRKAVKEAMSLAGKHGVKIHAKVADLEKAYAIPADAYDLIICFNYLQRSLFSSIKAGVKPGGIVVYETFIVDQAMFGKPKNPDHLLTHNELLQKFLDFRILRYHEGIMGHNRALAGVIARRPSA